MQVQLLQRREDACSRYKRPYHPQRAICRHVIHDSPRLNYPFFASCQVLFGRLQRKRPSYTLQCAY